MATTASAPSPKPSLLQRLRRTDTREDSSSSEVRKPSSRGKLLFSSRSRSRTQSVETLQSSKSSSCGNLPQQQPPEQREPNNEVNNVNSSVPDYQSQQEDISSSSSSTTTTPKNLMEWLQTDCPADCLPKILAYCGPQQTAVMSRTNRHFHRVVCGTDKREATWRVLCEELYKWKPGDQEPMSWFDLYRSSPCVPVDYSSIPKALQMAAATPPRTGRHRQTAPESKPQIRSVRILLRPGKHVLKQAVHVQAVPGVVVSLETVQLPKNLYRAPPAANSNGNSALHNSHLMLMEQPLPLEATTSSSSRSSPKPSFRNLFRCNRQESGEGESVTEDLTDFDEWLHHPNDVVVPQHATLLLRSRRHNEPAFRVSQGVLRLSNLEIQHNSHGLDIWNGNAAVQIQPPSPPTPDDEGANPRDHLSRPMAVLEKVQVTSRSGRGIVNIDGGKVIIHRCAVSDCAATGIYIGGPGSSAYIEETDVIRNGVGNPRPRRGIARGHSGIYLEQGVARIQESNVSHNTLTGISVVSPENAALHLEDSTLLSNGTYQLELPPPGTTSRQRCVTERNTMAPTGEAELRSGLAVLAPPPPPPRQPSLLQQQVLDFPPALPAGDAAVRVGQLNNNNNN